MSVKLFPIMLGHGGKMFIPWEIAEKAYEGYAKRFSSQSLERLAERGGFGDNEMDEYYPEWRSVDILITKLKEQRERMLKRLRVHCLTCDGKQNKPGCSVIGCDTKDLIDEVEKDLLID